MSSQQCFKAAPARRLTKIVATISDLRCDPVTLRAMMAAGVDVVRLNTAHQDEPATLIVIEKVRAATPEMGLLLDTKGPEVRTALIDAEHRVIVEEGTTVYVAANAEALERVRAAGHVGFGANYVNFVAEVPVGSRVLIDDGLVALRVVAKAADGTTLELRAENAGEIKNRKSLNTPDVGLRLPSVSEKDRSYLAFAARNGIDFVAHSFVRSKQDVEDVRSILDAHGSHAAIIAKIENREGIEHIDEILDVADGVMVARGDLGIEVPMEDVPIMQKMLIRKCLERAKPVITATQMLHSMMENPRPTRAEVSDVANAVFDGTDAVMLSGESASGKYPLEAVKTMARIVMRAEADRAARSRIGNAGCANVTGHAIRDCLCGAAIRAINTIPATALVCDTLSGRSARILSTFRACVPIFAQCHNQARSRQLVLSFGVFPRYMPLPNTADELIVDAIHPLLDTHALSSDDTVVFLAGSPHNPNGSNFVEINKVDLVLKGHEAALAASSAISSSVLSSGSA